MIKINKKKLHKGLEKYENGKKKYLEVTKIQRKMNKIKKALSDVKIGEEVILLKKNFPINELFLNLMHELKEEKVLKFTIVEKGIKVILNNHFKTKSKPFEKRLRYLRGTQINRRHFYKMEDENSKIYNVSLSKHFVHKNLEKILLIKGRINGSKVVAIKKIEEIE
ncbi:MAG: hypothetical protein WBG30_05585 [Psychrilyobacter sp.]|uniref:hypothetical protein n=1 Tax=Psychrilyobacter sp. TaxID=2586924 RepID=UPI003C72FA4F